MSSNANPPPTITITSPGNGDTVPAGAALTILGQLVDDTPPISVTLTNNNWQAGDPQQVQTLAGQMSGAPQWQTNQGFQIPSRTGVSLALSASATSSSCGVNIST
jgi:hypothetical protein